MASAPDRDRAGRRARRLLTLVLLAAAVLSVLGVVALTARRSRAVAAERQARADAVARGPRVRVARVVPSPGERAVALPGDVRAFWQTTLYGKVNGYVRGLHVDKGDRVREGEVIATIESPETDQQVAQARATLRVRQRNAARARNLAPKGFMTQQDLDQANADLGVAEGELRRLEALQAYQVLRAPFAGVVTARYVDPGALLTASATGAPVVELAAPDRVRVLVYVGQDVAPFVRLGDPAELTLDQLPGVRVQGHVRRVADALDPRTRSMLVEVWPDDGAVRLVPGLFAHVSVRVQVPSVPTVPAEALVTRGEKLQLAAVRDGRLHFVTIDPGMNDGRVLEVRSGISEGEVVALSPPSDLGEGAPIQPVSGQRPGEPPGGAGRARSARAAPPDRPPR